ncbi:MAG: Na/Pi cotransporter family protein [Lachnospiraceae bacterium]|nr:Na/Pi cotransporter family protein [Lachnospiraceae bacterium]
MNVLSFLNLFGGVGLFLFGMSLMGDSLQKLAGGKLEKILETLTTSKKKGVGEVKGWALGTGVTGIIQSSAATTLMLIGFVNAGIMKLSQAIPVVFGANVGSTFTAQILRLGDLGSGNLVLQLLKPSSFAPMLLAVGMVVVMATKKKKNNKSADIAGIMIGLGLLFYGMTLMEEVFAPLKDSPSFQKLFTSFNNPLIGILTGILLTAVIQSSSAAVGILQALSASGSVTYGIALPFILGQNIGKCMPIILGAIGATKKAKRVSISYILFNVFSTVGFAVLIYGLHYTVGLKVLSNVVNRGDIANVHLGINLITSLVLLPFCNQIANMTGKLTKDNEEPIEDEELQKLDDRLLETPAVALRQCINLINLMCDKVVENFNLSTGLLKKYDESVFTTLDKNESFLDKCETALSAYIIRIDRKSIARDNKFEVSKVLNSIGDLERIGDYCMNIAYVSQNNQEEKIVFTKAGQTEIDTIVSATKYAVETMVDAFKNDDSESAIRVEPLSTTINNLKEVVKSNHVERLQNGTCSIKAGVALFDLMNAFERIGGHSANIALHTIKRTRGDRSFDEMHGHTRDTNSEEYKALENYYFTKYMDPIVNRKLTDEDYEEYIPEKVESEKEERIAEKISKKYAETKDKRGKDLKEKKKEIKEKSEKVIKEKKEKVNKVKNDIHEKKEKIDKTKNDLHEKKNTKKEKSNKNKK